MDNKKPGFGSRRLRANFCRIAGLLMLLSVICSSLPLTVLRIKGDAVYAVISGSMEPMIPTGSAVYVEEIAPDAVRAGDVIAFQSGESIVVHRVVENRQVVGEYVTKGDANNIEDIKTAPYASLIGIVRRHIPGLGRFLMLYSEPLGKACALCFAVCGALLMMLGTRISEQAGESEAESKENIIAPEGNSPD